MTYGLSAMRAGLALCVPEGVRRRLRVSLESERGQAFVEYVLLLTIVAIAVALITEWHSFTDAVKNALNTISNTITNESNKNKSTT